MEYTPVLSVITASHNQSEYLSDCLQSVSVLRSEPFSPIIEHIIVDDASTDSTRSLLKRNMSNNTVLYNNDKIGPAASRNKAIAQANGKYIFVLDSDDVILQRTLYHFTYALENSNQQWAYSDFIRSNKNLSYEIANDYYGWNFASIKEMLQAIVNGSFFIQHNMYFRKDLFLNVGGYDENLYMAEDLDLSIRFLLAEQLPLYIPITSHIHRNHDKNISLGQGGEQHKRTAKTIAKKYQVEFEKLGVFITD